MDGMDGMDGMGWDGSPGGPRYRAPTVLIILIQILNRRKIKFYFVWKWEEIRPQEPV